MFYKIINTIKLNLNFKNKMVKINLNKSDFKILKIFLKLNIIKNIKLYKKKTYIITLNNSTVLKNIINLYKPSKPVKITLKNIIKINRKRSNLFFLSTNTGIINNIEAEKNKIGGILIFKILI